MEGPTTDEGANPRSFNDRPAQEAYPFAYFLGKSSMNKAQREHEHAKHLNTMRHRAHLNTH
eukprot:7988693-Heterocapsa_arctica.AAC.1